MSIFLLCNNLLWAQEKFENDGLYAIFSFEKEFLAYRLSIADAPDAVLRFLNYFGGEIEQNAEAQSLFKQPRAIVIDAQISDYAVTAGADSWSVAEVEHLLPAFKGERQLEGALSFWRQRGQLRDDRLLFIYPGSYLADNQAYYHFASLVKGDLGNLKENGQLYLSELVAQGLQASQWLEQFMSGELQALSTAKLWENYWKQESPEIVGELTTLERDAFGFYLEKEAFLKTDAGKASDDDSVEFSYRVSSLELPLGLQPTETSVAILGRDRIEPIIAHFLRRIPVGSSWEVIVPPYLSPNDKDLWLRYEISVKAIF